MSDEEDYMSMNFLNVKEDIRPGLVHSSSVKRKYDLESKQKELNKFQKTKSRKVLEEESRNSGLNTALGSDNKGFALLQKMGYKPGMKLGSNEKTSDTGLIEPIRVTVKTNRGGLGREDHIREQRQKIRTYREQETEALTQDFRERMRSACSYKQNMQELSRCQKTCEQLDRNSDISEPQQPWFWFTQAKEDNEEEETEEYEDEEEEEEDINIEEKVVYIVGYLRTKYFYCFWCGINYDDKEDMVLNCPGPDKNDHEDIL